ncbi:unnamed protein product [Didymodactylos carnosus]|uniref:LamG domain-containing protein n=1 Tax=Didymodactylos carnosus TaxID=1234261 RepID=A0A8S2Q824_9BILA|nr:unnamed protein product [Didymodactylos carnosus]CAF4093787.1 unnamed protein product [Didymodactylos carnosus]
MVFVNNVRTACDIMIDATLAAYYSMDLTFAIIRVGCPINMTDSLDAQASGQTNYTNGHINQAFEFNFAISYFQTGYGFTFLGEKNQAYSFSLWINLIALTGTVLHVSSSNTGLDWCLPVIGFSSSGSIIAQTLNSNLTVITAQGPILSLNTWTHFVVTWGSTNGLKLYINGTLVTTVSVTSFSANNGTILPKYVTLANPLSGVSCSKQGLIGTPGQFYGRIDEFYIFAKELNTSDVCVLCSYK